MIAAIAAMAALQASPQVAVALEPDTVRVGEPFSLAIALSSRADTAVRFPPVLPADSAIEGTGPPATSSDGGGPRWRAVYPVRAWKTGEHALPPLTVRLAGGPGTPPRVLRIDLPAVVVNSVLPVDTASLELMPARPPIDLLSWWWLVWLLLAVLMAVGVWRVWKSRARAEDEPEAADPAEIALARLRELRKAFETGMAQDAYYDSLERILRSYVTETRSWPPGTPVAALRRDGDQMPETFDRSARARFGRTRAEREAAAGDVARSESWLHEDRARRRPAAAEEAR